MQYKRRGNLSLTKGLNSSEHRSKDLSEVDFHPILSHNRMHCNHHMTDLRKGCSGIVGISLQNWDNSFNLNLYSDV